MSKRRNIWLHARLLAMAVSDRFPRRGLRRTEVRPTPNKSARPYARPSTGWQAGEAFDSLASQSQPIHVVEPKWGNGFRLVGYQVGLDVKSEGFDLICPVELWMKDPKGKEVHEKARYIVSAKPERTVVARSRARTLGLRIQALWCERVSGWFSPEYTCLRVGSYPVDAVLVCELTVKRLSQR